jgi:hypothetical protein
MSTKVRAAATRIRLRPKRRAIRASDLAKMMVCEQKLVFEKRYDERLTRHGKFLVGCAGGLEDLDGYVKPILTNFEQQRHELGGALHALGRERASLHQTLPVSHRKAATAIRRVRVDACCASEED